MKIAVAQLGARMHYAVPEILDSNGLLTQFYTDIYSKSLIKSLGKQFSSSLFSKLNNRKSQLLNDHSIKHYPLMGLSYKFETSKIKSLKEKYRVYNKYNALFAKKVANDIDWKNTDAVYVFNSAAKEIIEKAHDKGKKVILEQCIAPFVVEQAIVYKEYEKFPEWNNLDFNEYLDCSEFQIFKNREIEELKAADMILCPSTFVLESVKNFVENPNKLKLVPYGVSNKVEIRKKNDLKSNDVLRVLTVGAGLRKGTQYVLEAAKKLQGEVIFTLLGDLGTINPKIKGEIGKYIDFKGHVPRHEVQKYYEQADVFLLPSLCEGSATATYEAYSFGLPVIATQNTGALIEHGVDGFIIPSSSYLAIIEAIKFIKEKNILSRLSENAKIKAKECSKESYAFRLLNAISIL